MGTERELEKKERGARTERRHRVGRDRKRAGEREKGEQERERYLPCASPAS